MIVELTVLNKNIVSTFSMTMFSLVIFIAGASSVFLASMLEIERFKDKFKKQEYINLNFDKPGAQIYVDDKSINPKEIKDETSN